MVAIIHSTRRPPTDIITRTARRATRIAIIIRSIRNIRTAAIIIIIIPITIVPHWSEPIPPRMHTGTVTPTHHTTRTLPRTGDTVRSRRITPPGITCIHRSRNPYLRNCSQISILCLINVVIRVKLLKSLLIIITLNFCRNKLFLLLC